ncbi:hypothetical protein NL676_010244 [Syzygium grande]|nr:hypothetical protein NL676_010244 [Syzygium grande]
MEFGYYDFNLNGVTLSKEQDLDVFYKKFVESRINGMKLGGSPIWELNYPSISVSFKPSVAKVSVTRTVRNVGPAKSHYQSVIDPIKGLDSIGVYPHVLVFTEANQTASYRVDFMRRVDRKATALPPFAQGAITWVSARHSVRTPVAVVFE